MRHAMAPRRSIRRLAAAAGLALGLTGMATGNAVAAGHSQTDSAPLVVQTDKGAVQGFFTAGAREFLGIPYAAPPVGDLRWRPPQPAAPWSGVRDATTLPPACAQLENSNGPRSESEDCLYLSIYKPSGALRGAKLPVLFWIHGGGLTTGTGNQHDGTLMA